MSKAEAHKLKSGTWRCKANYTDDYGNYKQKSFTAKTKREAEMKADRFLQDIDKYKEPSNKTLGMIIDEYIENRSNVLSPATILGYEQIRRNAFPDIIDTPISKLTSALYQRAINSYAKEHSPKSVANAHMLAKGALRKIDIDIANETNLPQKKKKEKAIPDEKEVKDFIAKVKDYRIYLPCLIASSMGLRWSEIIALKWKDIDLDKKKASVCQARVRDKYNTFVLKDPKTTESNRVLKIPKIVIDNLPERLNDDDFVIQGSVKSLYSQYQRVSKALGFNYTFHAFRHFYASELMKKNIPIKYIQQRMGHATTKMLNEVYQHTFPSENERIDTLADDAFTSLFE